MSAALWHTMPTTFVWLLGQRFLRLTVSYALITLHLDEAAEIMSMLMLAGVLYAQKEAAFCAVILVLLLFIGNA